MSFIRKTTITPFESARARECVGQLDKIKLTERDEMAQLNDQFVDIIEHVHYMEAEHAALEHDYNLLKTGIQSDSTSINEIFEVEIRNVKIQTEHITQNRQQLLIDQNNLAQQARQAEDQWRHVAKAALGVPREVDEDFKRISDIEAENSLTLRRIKYVEDKNRLIKQSNGRIYEQINLMRMRKDQAVSLHHEFILRKNELLNSIRTMEEDNKRVIMNEHKHFVRDRPVDRHTFRDQLHQAIAEIRADYEFKRLRNAEESRVRLEREIHRLNNNPSTNITWDRLREDLAIVKKNSAGLQLQVSQIEIRNATLTQQIEQLRLEISESHHTFEISIDCKIKETEKLREECTSLSLQLEKLCDLNIDLQHEIAKYRELMDKSGQVVPAQLTGRTAGLSGTWNRFQNTRTETIISAPPRIPSPSPVRYDPVPNTISAPHRIPSPSPVRYDPVPNTIAAPHRIPSPSPVRYDPVPNTISAPHRIPSPSPVRYDPVPNTIYAPHRIPSPSPVRYDPVPNTIAPSVGGFVGTSPAPPPISTIPTIPRTQEFEYERTQISSRPLSGTGLPYNPYSSVYEGLRDYSNSGSVVGQHKFGSGVQVTGTSRHTHGTTEKTGYMGRYSHQNAGSESTTSIYEHIHHDSPAPIRQPVPQAAPPAPRYISEVENTSSSDSVDEDNFQRFTRWYKGRVKISDVTPDFIQIVNRSSKKSADIGGFKIIHEFGHNSVYVDLPASLILAPKDCLKIYARGSKFEHGSVYAEIDQFNTSIHTNTSIRNTNNEVKSWFVYTSNTEIGDHHH